MHRKVVYARTQTEVYVAGAGGLGTVFPPQSKTLDNLQMASTDRGLSILFTYRGMNKEILVPYANVVLMELAPEEKKEIKPNESKAR